MTILRLIFMIGFIAVRATLSVRIYVATRFAGIFGRYNASRDGYYSVTHDHDDARNKLAQWGGRGNISVTHGS